MPRFKTHRRGAALATVLVGTGCIPEDKPLLPYCKAGTLSAQAGFALRAAGQSPGH